MVVPQAVSHQVVYNPTPPLNPVAAKSAGCLGLLGGLMVLVALTGLLLAAVH